MENKRFLLATPSAGVVDKIEVRIGPAVDALHDLERTGADGSFDLIFIDADKANYAALWD
jgi:predicted O-methyltransferase YrrM